MLDGLDLPHEPICNALRPTPFFNVPLAPPSLVLSIGQSHTYKKTPAMEIYKRRRAADEVSASLGPSRLAPFS